MHSLLVGHTGSTLIVPDTDLDILNVCEKDAFLYHASEIQINGIPMRLLQRPSDTQEQGYKYMKIFDKFVSVVHPRIG